MILDLTGKTAVITGSSLGIGWGCAHGLAAAGATVILTGRRQDTLSIARERLLIAVQGATVRAVASDLSTVEGCEHLLTVEPRCDILVNNLGVYEPKPFFETPDADWEALYQVNVMSGVRLSRGYVPMMMNRGWGRVVFLSSVDGIAIPVDSLHYGVTKAGVLALSRGLAKVTGRTGVTVNAVLPGVTGVEWVKDMIAGMALQNGQAVDEAGAAAVAARYPTSITQRVQSVEEVANLVVYLCSPSSSATTGAALRADGGIIETLC
ncbi:SDR family NAD(P)-dependent oxidoreductase [Methylobacterium sp. E-046]|uniref:SDR family NAD(P)-dependent oxidoreductase n=1 Tax=Methylobacterium sp. E-046 TaxID=2836576 RepID=UPI001FBB9180|nr:SDR family oxidoreductase [Methylobacterium sp. E-046]MCJ2103514.1 SDR family oxidoreductase [Methylobacterium sp. E-046]